ncbi:MAG TPA: hypothetical protein DHU26_07195 [Spirochaetaceae bacterium]|nr:hypothetical protein [Spirochaetaceae bacterium]
MNRQVEAMDRRAARYAELLKTPIGSDIERYVRDNTVIFAFPSQDAADSWARALLASKVFKAVALDRFLGFEPLLRTIGLDDERERESERAGTRMAQHADRWAWAIRALESLKGSEAQHSLVLRRILPTLPGGESYSISHLLRLVRLVPALYEIDAYARQSRKEPLGSAEKQRQFAFLREELEDLKALARHYRDFLNDQNIIDYHFLAQDQSLSSGHHVRAYGLKRDFARLGLGIEHEQSRLYFPESALPDFSEIRLPPYIQFDSAIDEIEYVFASISEEIEQGLEPEDIAISVCRLNPQKAAWIRQIAADCGVPVSIRSGSPLSSTPFGRLLRAIQQASREGLTLDALDSLAAFTSIQNRDPEAWRQLRITAARAHIPSPSPNAAYVHGLWKESAQIGMSVLNLVQKYDALWKDITEVAQSKNFSGLYLAILRFLERWVDTTKLSAQSYTDRSMRMALDELQAFVEREDSFQTSHFSPFEVYLAALSTKNYIPVMAENAVRVFDFGTTAGLAAISQYIIGASQDGLAAYFENQTALRSELASLLGLDGTYRIEELVALHSLGDAHFSFARESFDGYEVAHPFFGAALAENANAMRNGTASVLSRVPRRVERAIWQSTTMLASDTPLALTKGQKQRFSEGFSAFPGHLAFDTRTYAHPAPLDAPIAKRFLKATDSFDFDRDFAIFSPHSLRDRMRCGFRWFASRIGAADMYALDDLSMILGNFLHTTYQRIIRALMQHASASTSSEVTDDIFLDIFKQAAKTTAEEMFASKGPGIRPALMTYFDRARHRLKTLQEFEALAFQPYRREGFELPFEHVFDSEKAILRGRIDCIFSRIDESAGNAQCLVIIDYKKNSIPKASAMRPRGQESSGVVDDSDDIEDTASSMAVQELQVPLYALAEELDGKLVEGALYWSIEKAEGVAYIAPPALPPGYGLAKAFKTASETADVRAVLRQTLAAASMAVRNGELIDLALDRASCGDCPFRALCRYWYFLES